MRTRNLGTALRKLAAGLAWGGLLGMVSPVSAATGRVLVPANGPYLKECGACHMAFSPELLPGASWRQMMARLDDHFGESARVDASTQSAITGYLVANAADHAGNVESRAIMESLNPGEVPSRITKVPYIAALHAAVLDPLWNGTPRPKTLTECGVCHDEVGAGNYKTRIFHVTDEAFSGK
jgi:hypothetical protein